METDKHYFDGMSEVDLNAVAQKHGQMLSRQALERLTEKLLAKVR
jgi:hypothetical protein